MGKYCSFEKEIILKVKQKETNTNIFIVTDSADVFSVLNRLRKKGLSQIMIFKESEINRVRGNYPLILAKFEKPLLNREVEPADIKEVLCELKYNLYSFLAINKYQKSNINCSDKKISKKKIFLQQKQILSKITGKNINLNMGSDLFKIMSKYNLIIDELLGDLKC